MSRFIVVEGVDGAGKTTLMQGLCRHFMECGMRFIGTREPGGTPLAENIRLQLLGPKGQQLTPQQQLELVHWGRTDHVINKISPALLEGAIVLSDRYELSSWVYQVAADESLRERFFAMQSELRDLLGAREPQYILLDLSETEAQKRLKDSKKLNHFDATELEAIRKRRDAYLVGIREIGSPYHILDGSFSPDVVLKEALRVLNL